MRKIRRGVFETNSSSMHSISAVGGDRIENTKVFEGNETLQFGGYGWAFDRLNTPLKKAQYIGTYLAQGYDNTEEFMESFEFEHLQDAIYNMTGVKVKFVGEDNSWYPNGYIDHQSSRMLWEDYFEEHGINERSIKELIFNQKYVIVIDNDNH